VLALGSIKFPVVRIVVPSRTHYDEPAIESAILRQWNCRPVISKCLSWPVARKRTSARAPFTASIARAAITVLADGNQCRHRGGTACRCADALRMGNFDRVARRTSWTSKRPSLRHGDNQPCLFSSLCRPTGQNQPAISGQSSTCFHAAII